MALISKPINLSTEANLLYEIYRTLSRIHIVGGSGGGGVQSVTGTLVDNTDPLNPIINTPSFAESLAIDNKTNDIPIVSNNGKAVVNVNDDYTALSYGPQSFAMTDTETQLYSEVPVAFDSTVSTDFSTPILRHNGAELATKNWVTTQGESISTAKIINRCPSTAFRNAHGNLAIGNSWYLGTRGDVSTPSAMVYFPDLNDLSTYQKVSMSSTTLGGIEYLAYNETLGKIYSCLNGNKLLVFNDITDVSDYTIIDLTLSAGVVRAGAVVMTDDAHIYIGTNGVTNSHFIKLDATDYSEVTVTEWTGRPSIHSGTWNADKSVLRFCQNGEVCYRALVNPIDLSYTEKYVGDSITDDIAYVVNIFAYDFFDMVIYPAENRVSGTKGCYVENPDTEEFYTLDCLPSYGIFIDYDNSLIYFSTIEGSLEVFTFQSLVDSVKGYIDPKLASTVYVNPDKNKFNEINKIDGKVFATIWNNDTSFGEDGKGALVELDLITVKNGAISKSEEVYRTDRYLKAEYNDSVISASYIDIQFANGDWNTLVLKDYGINITPNNSASANAIDKWYPSNKNGKSFRLNFDSPVTADLDLTIIINP